MSGYTFTIADNPDAAMVGKYQAALAKIRPACTRCGKTLTAGELKRIGAETRASVRVCADRTECTLRQCWAGSHGMDLAGFRALRKWQAAHPVKRADVRETIATPAPIEHTPVPVDTPVPVLDSPAHVSGITTVLAPVRSSVVADDIGVTWLRDFAAPGSAWIERVNREPHPDPEPRQSERGTDSLIGAYARMFV